MVLRAIRTALLEAWTNRASFYFQVAIMIANDLSLVVFWFLFFSQVGEVRGWDSARVLTLIAILATVTGIGMGLLGNVRRLGEIISSGELDAVLPLPVDPLAYLLVRRVDTALLGDLVFGPALFVLFGAPTLQRTVIYVLVSLCGTVVFVSFLVGLGSLTFLIGGRGQQAELGWSAILILSSYPVDFLGGLTKVLVFTAVPAAFVTGVPASLVDEFSWSSAALLVGVAAVFAAGSRALFQIGLHGYRSGASWTRA